MQSVEPTAQTTLGDPAPTDPPAPSGPDRTTRQAALWATVVAVPLAALVAVLAIGGLNPQTPAAAPRASATAGPQSTAPVPMAAPPLAERPAVVCRALLSKLPATLRDLAQRPVQAGPEQNAAYGDPALTVACGVPEPSVGRTDDLWQVNQVCWHVVEGAEAAVLTTVDREVPVRVTVPRIYEQPLQRVAPVSDSVLESVPSATGTPSDCGR